MARVDLNLNSHYERPVEYVRIFRLAKLNLSYPKITGPENISKDFYTKLKHFISKVFIPHLIPNPYVVTVANFFRIYYVRRANLVRIIQALIKIEVVLIIPKSFQMS